MRNNLPNRMLHQSGRQIFVSESNAIRDPRLYTVIYEDFKEKSMKSVLSGGDVKS